MDRRKDTLYGTQLRGRARSAGGQADGCLFGLGWTGLGWVWLPRASKYIQYTSAERKLILSVKESIESF